jgi:histidine triad (HIT) family protein
VTPVSEEGCDFCAIVRSEDPDAEIVCEDANWVAFFPLNPATPGHTLVIPRTHVADLWDLEPPLSADLMTAIIRVGHAVQAALRPEGMNLITSAGKTAEQTVFHLHFHIVPRWSGDGFGRIWPLDHKYENADLENVADRIREACGSLDS